MRGLFVILLTLASSPIISLWAAGQQEDGAAELATARAQILKNDYPGAQLSISLYRGKIVMMLRQSPGPAGNAKDLIMPPGATGRDHLLSMLDQVAQMQSSGDLKSTLNYATALWYAVAEERRRTRPTPAQRLETMEQLIQASTGSRRMMALSMAAKAALEAGHTGKARNYSNETLRLAGPPVNTWRQADALYLAHIIAGRLALRSQDLDGARRHLTAAAGIMSAAPSAAAMGPDIPFAAELVDAGERDAVLSYLSDCARYWKADDGKTAQWSELIRQGKQPWAEWIQLHPPAR